MKILPGSSVTGGVTLHRVVMDFPTHGLVVLVPSAVSFLFYPCVLAQDHRRSLVYLCEVTKCTEQRMSFPM